MRNHIPKAVPTEFGTNLRCGAVVNPHNPQTSVGRGARGSMTTGVLVKIVARDVAHLANARTPKYAVRGLFLEVIAYTLRWKMSV